MGQLSGWNGKGWVQLIVDKTGRVPPALNLRTALNTIG